MAGLIAGANRQRTALDIASSALRPVRVKARADPLSCLRKPERPVLLAVECPNARIKITIKVLLRTGIFRSYTARCRQSDLTGD
jgi:hypothetical protein